MAVQPDHYGVHSFGCPEASYFLGKQGINALLSHSYSTGVFVHPGPVCFEAGCLA